MANTVNTEGLVRLVQGIGPLVAAHEAGQVDDVGLTTGINAAQAALAIYRAVVADTTTAADLNEALEQFETEVPPVMLGGDTPPG